MRVMRGLSDPDDLGDEIDTMDSRVVLAQLIYMYSDDSLIRTRFFPVDISGLTNFPDY